MSASAAVTDSHDPLKDLVQEVFHEYITNEMPIRLLHITKDDQKIEFKLVDRDFVREHFETHKKVPDKIHAEFSKTMLVDAEDREDHIREHVKKELKYAIFSHRWLPDKQESRHDHMLKEPMVVPNGRETGCEKLGHFCRTAKDIHDCEFAWSDTCCIDKTSSSELDESIRSMFRWYRNSHVCIAFLSQTADLADLQKQERGEGGKKARIDGWFIRGWTLQELLAPSQIKFYGADWKPLIQRSTNYDFTNDRGNEVIMGKISELTDIDKVDLKSFRPGTDRVPEKLLWASRRRTSRIEDIAYCLIGIFDISLMIAYGEGNRAFFRLMEEILKRYDKWDVFLWSGRCSRYNAALPDAPHSYAAKCIKTIQAANHEIGDRRFALTNHGLEIRVLLLCIEVENTSEELPDSRCLWFKHDHFRVRATHIGPKPDKKSWAIGVLDYWVDGDEGSIDGGTPFTGFLLSSNADASPHLKAASKWKKEMTKEVVTIESSDHAQERLTLLYL